MPAAALEEFVIFVVCDGPVAADTSTLDVESGEHSRCLLESNVVLEQLARVTLRFDYLSRVQVA